MLPRRILRAFQHVAAADLGPLDQRLDAITLFQEPYRLFIRVHQRLPVLHQIQLDRLALFPEVFRNDDLFAVAPFVQVVGDAIRVDRRDSRVRVFIPKIRLIHALRNEAIIRILARRKHGVGVEVHRKRVGDTFDPNVLVERTLMLVISQDAPVAHATRRRAFRPALVHARRGTAVLNVTDDALKRFRHLGVSRAVRRRHLDRGVGAANVARDLAQELRQLVNHQTRLARAFPVLPDVIRPLLNAGQKAHVV